MAACSEVEEKASFSKESVPPKVLLGETAGRSELTKKLSEKTKTELNNMSENAFQDLLEDIVSFNKPMNLGCGVIKDLITEVSETHEKSNVGKHSDYKHKMLLSDSSNSSNHRTFDDKKKIIRNREDSKSTLNSDKNIQQSLSLQDLLSPDSKIKKPHKAHRTLSLSSEESANVISDPLTFKSSKKSNKQSSVSKNQSNRSSSNKYSPKTPSENSGSPLANADSGQKRKYDSLIQTSILPYQTLINEIDIPLPEGPMPEEMEKRFSSVSPVEIEMEEFKSDKGSTKDDKNNVRTIEKSKSNPQQSSSKFYLDSNDVDGPANCSIQFNSYPASLEDQNGSQVNFPIHWTKPVHSFIGSFGEAEDYNASRSDKPILNTDINGNPFSRSPRTSLASIVSTTFLDYGNNTLMTESKNRKTKRLRNSVNKGVLSENIAGHRGEEDIEALLQYINSSDKKGKSVKGSSQNQLMNNKSVLHENDKKKGFGKDLKSSHKNMMNNVKKKLSRSNSMENLTSNNNVKTTERDNDLSYESNAMLDKPLKNSKTAALENSTKKKLDVNSNLENRFAVANDKNKNYSNANEMNEPNSSFEENSSDVSSFAADFYSTADVSSQTVEEAGFLIVKKKQRKKHQGKRSDSYRWRTAQNQRKKGMMLPLAESKCGKQDSRRKSTSSVPHSEHSSADNSDLDSVHSLPVRGSVPHPTQPHPHTTPSSSSSTPQASYADIARMPIPKLNSPSPCIITYSVQSSVVKQQVGDSASTEFRKPECTMTNFPHVKRKDSPRCECAPVVNKNTAHTSAMEEDSADVKLRLLAKSTRECNTQTEPEPTESECTSAENEKLKKAEEAPKSVCTFCLCPPKKNCSCSNRHQTRHKIKSTEIPPVIMDNMPAETNACNVSFGFGVDEVLQMNPTETSELKVKVETPPNSVSKDLSASEKPKTVTNNAASDIDSCKSPAGVSLKSVTHNSDLPSETSSQLRTVSFGTGRKICYSETKVNTKKFNLSEITNFLGKEFECIEKELGSKNNEVSSKVMYYTDSSEEA